MAQLKSLSIDGNPVADFIVEQGTSSIWTYRKWNSGAYEAWYQNENTSAYTFSNKYGATVSNNRIMYTTDNIDYNVPSFSKSVTFYTGTASATTLFSWGLIWMEGATLRVRVATNTVIYDDYTSSLRIDLYIKGTWK